MRFSPADDLLAEEVLLPLAHVVALGGEEEIGLVDSGGRFVPVRHPALLQPHRMVGLAAGLAMLAPCETELLDLDGERVALLEFAAREGRAVCVRVSAAEGQELTGSLLREVPLATLARQAVEANVVRLFRTSDDFLFAATFPSGGPGFGDSATELRQRYEDVLGRPGRRPLSDEFLASVADVYRRACAEGLPPAIEVERRLGPTSSTNARRWVALARRRGFLGPARGRGARGESG